MLLKLILSNMSPMAIMHCVTGTAIDYCGTLCPVIVPIFKNLYNVKAIGQ